MAGLSLRPLCLRTVRNVLGHVQRRHESVWHRMFGGKKYIQQKQEELLRARAELKEDITTNFTKDLSEYRVNRGKRFQAPAFICQTKDSIPAPTFKDVSLGGAVVTFPDDLKGKVTLVVLGLRGISQKVMDLYRVPFQNNFGNILSCQVFEIPIIEQRVFQPFKFAFAGSLKKIATDIQRQNHIVMLCPTADELRDLRNRFKIYNALTGYAALIDVEGNIRWLAHGEPSPAEVQRMVDCTQVLLSSVGKRPPSA